MRSWFVVGLLAGIPAGSLASTQATLEPSKLGGPVFDAGQIVQADRRGEVWLFDVAELEVHPLAGGKFQAAGTKLEPIAAAGMRTEPRIHRAALSPDGSQWLFDDMAVGLRWFVDGKEQPIIQPEWKPSGLGFLGGSPLVIALPLRRGGFEGYGDSDRPIPGMLGWSGDGWEMLSEAPVDFEADPGPAFHSQATAQRSALFASSKNGGAWIGFEFLGRLRELSPSGRVKSNLEWGNPEIEIGKPTAADQQNFAELEAASKSRGSGIPAGMAARFAPQDRPMRRLRALAVHGTTPYALGLADQETRFLLIRYEAVSAQLEQVPMTLKPTPTGVVTMAAGKDGLVLVDYSPGGARWLLPWERIDNADWQPLEPEPE